MIDDNASHMAEALQGASSIQLYQMRTLIDGMPPELDLAVMDRFAAYIPGWEMPKNEATDVAARKPPVVARNGSR